MKFVKQSYLLINLETQEEAPYFTFNPTLEETKQVLLEALHEIIAAARDIPKVETLLFPGKP